MSLRKLWYGTTLRKMDESFREELLLKQANRCAICGVKISKSGHIDHDHETNFVRGMLCNQCNLGLGMFHDDSEILRSAAQYLDLSQDKLTMLQEDYDAGE